MEDITAYTSTVVLSEVLHRLMIAEVVEKHGIEPHRVNLYVMKTNDLRDMVTNDSDFDEVEWLNVWKP